MKVVISGMGSLAKTLNTLANKFGQDKSESVTVGFTQRYAIYVHEVQATHKVGQWKYLETPTRYLKREMARMIEVAMKNGVNLRQSLMFAGLRLQREAQLLTPVDTSALKASAFTCPTKDIEAISQAAFAKSENIRQAELASRSKRKRIP